MSVGVLENTVIVSDAEERHALAGVGEVLKESLGRRTPYLLGSDGEKIELPESLFQIMRQAVALLARGERISIASIHKELTSQEAADLLNVSRPFLIKLLDANELPYHRVGRRHRRIRFGDVITYQERRLRARRQRLHELIQISADAGLYDDDEPLVAGTRG